MRRLMIDMTQEKLAAALGLTFQQVQKYEKGKNRIGASRLQHLAHTLQVPIAFFFEGAAQIAGQPKATCNAPSPDYVSDFLTMPNGLALTKGFTRLKNRKLRRSIVALVEEIAGDH